VDNVLDSREERKLVNKALKWTRMSYAPYSKFRVGAALLTRNGKVYTGCNIENASYGLTVCAERVAVFKAVSEGEKEFKALCLAVSGNSEPSMCGACRQVLSEFAENLEVIYVNNKGLKENKELSHLLPEPFRLI
jgi:cytidine deaminase